MRGGRLAARCPVCAQSLGASGTVGLGSVARGFGSPDDLPKSNNVEWQQDQVQNEDGRQPLDRAIGDEGEIAKDGERAQQAHVLGDEGE